MGTLDTKGQELDYARTRLQQLGLQTLLVDVGVMGEPLVAADVTREEVAAAAGIELARLVAEGDRGEAVETMARGAAEVAARLHADGRLAGIMSLCGSAGARIAATAMRALPLGVPKLLVSTVVGGDTRPYIGTADITMMYAVLDVSGINRISSRIITNAAGALAGMITVEPPVAEHEERPIVAATMFGVTTPCVTRARERLERAGYEVLVFHSIGIGGDSMEALVRDGLVDAVLDVTTTELADELAGGICASGPGRLDLSDTEVPRVVSLGALDMVNFGPIDSVPSRYADRTLYQHNAAITLMRTSAQECAELGRTIARRINAAKGPLAVAIPRGGLSAIDAEGQPFHSPEANAALFDALLADLRPDVEVLDLSYNINDPAFADAIADLLVGMARAQVPS
ncbi:Tm-1-like ATP-binding domain-containing protein [Conexibacter sp. CPCC 206217]|uniref:Tm-1-like ATP-binding domain-containing protein n=1 Tax=Conexibacter sp. CPCC 206217 TaxID=3064574 RepID=UPI00271DDDBC|nr:Tm-1-like ATP-binding domain-containing protein [Conexibacter sp. CPCC 206217]MDO8213560.1 Tm-1-like ATP-binding domain-containing protein [Conexibacter sp. CPCC 206217]